MVRSEQGYTLPGLLDPCRYSQGCLLHFSTVPPYLLLNQLDESFMHRKLKNTVEEYVDEGSDERKQQEKDEGERVVRGTEAGHVKMKEWRQKQRGDLGKPNATGMR